MRRIDWNTLDADGRREALARPVRRTEGQVTDVVRDIFDDVRARGGAAITDWSLKFDGFAPRRIAITPEAVAAAREALPPTATRSLRIAAENVRVFHQATRPEDTAFFETTPAIRSMMLSSRSASSGSGATGERISTA